MALNSVRIAGVNLPVNKKVYVSLSYLFGIGRVLGKKICDELKINSELRMSELNDSDVEKILEAVYEKIPSGRVGDGKVFVEPIYDAMRIRTGERGEKAL